MRKSQYSKRMNNYPVEYFNNLNTENKSPLFVKRMNNNYPVNYNENKSPFVAGMNNYPVEYSNNYNEY